MMHRCKASPLSSSSFLAASRITGAAAWISRKGAVQCTASIASHCFEVILWIMPSHVNPAHHAPLNFLGEGTHSAKFCKWANLYSASQCPTPLHRATSRMPACPSHHLLETGALTSIVDQDVDRAKGINGGLDASCRELFSCYVPGQRDGLSPLRADLCSNLQQFGIAVKSSYCGAYTSLAKKCVRSLCLFKRM